MKLEPLPKGADQGRRCGPVGVEMLAVVALGGTLLSCDPPSSHVDGGDLHGVFERDGAAPTASAAGSGSAAASPSSPATHSEGVDGGRDVLPELRRRPIAGPCVRVEAPPAPQRSAPASSSSSSRPAGRPGCRGARILEWRDGGGNPRYACIFEPDGLERRAPLPLLVFFHSDGDSPRTVDRKTQLRSRSSRHDMTGDPAHQGFVVVAPQGLRRGGRIRFDATDPSAENLDLAATDHFVDQLLAEGVVDPRKIYAVGDGTGARMALFYAYARPSRIAAFGMYASEGSGIEWSCAERPPPGWLAYRACDGVSPCEAIELWTDARLQQGATLATVRLDDGRRDEPSCDRSKRCKGNRAQANHARWPKEREKDLLDYLARFSLDVAPREARTAPR